MKNIIILFSILLLSKAYGSKARLLSLGENIDNGSFYIPDERNIFLNPAHILDFPGILSFEWGSNGNANEIDEDSSPKAEGGFVMEYSSFSFGAYLGRETHLSDYLVTLAGSDLKKTDNSVTLSFGMNPGIKWAGQIFYSSNQDKRSSGGVSPQWKQTTLSTRFGVKSLKWNGFAEILFIQKSEGKSFTGEPKFDGKLGAHVGGGFKLGSVDLFLSYEDRSWDQELTTVGVVSKTKGHFSNAHLGVGYKRKVGAKSELFTRISATRSELGLKFSSRETKFTYYSVPLVVGYEFRPFEWLSLRGSIKQFLYGTVNEENMDNLNTTARELTSIRYGVSSTGSNIKGRKSLANSTDITAGASLHFGKLTIDGLIGTTGASRADGASGVFDGEKGVLALDNLMTRVSMNYRW